MRKNQKDQKSDPEPYEDMLRLEKLDPYENQLQSKLILKQKQKK